MHVAPPHSFNDHSKFGAIFRESIGCNCEVPITTRPPRGYHDNKDGGSVRSSNSDGDVVCFLPMQVGLRWVILSISQIANASQTSVIHGNLVIDWVANEDEIKNFFEDQRDYLPDYLVDYMPDRIPFIDPKNVTPVHWIKSTLSGANGKVCVEKGIDGQYYNVRRHEYWGEGCHSFSLKHFPFDTQNLDFCWEASAALNTNSVVFVASHIGSPIKVTHSTFSALCEWKFSDLHWFFGVIDYEECKFPNGIRNGNQWKTAFAVWRIRLQRNASSIVSLMALMTFMALLSCAFVALLDSDDIETRIALRLMFLIVQYFLHLYVITKHVPRIDYYTFFDWYSLFSISVIFCNLFNDCTHGWYLKHVCTANDHNDQHWNIEIVIISIFVVGHVLLVVCYYCCVKKHSRRTSDDSLHERCTEFKLEITRARAGRNTTNLH